MNDNVPMDPNPDPVGGAQNRIPIGDGPDHRFITGLAEVMTNAADLALVVAIGWDSDADIHSNVDRVTAAALLRRLADRLDAAGG